MKKLIVILGIVFMMGCAFPNASDRGNLSDAMEKAKDSSFY